MDDMTAGKCEAKASRSPPGGWDMDQTDQKSIESHEYGHVKK